MTGKVRKQPFRMPRVHAQSIAPLFLALEPLLEKFSRRSFVVLSAHYYPDQHGNFDEHGMNENLNYLKEACNVLTLGEAMDRLEQCSGFPRRSVVLIVDDAARSFYEYGWPHLAEFQIPFTLAVIPGLIKSSHKDHLLSRLMRIAGHEYDLPHNDMLSRAFEWMEAHGGYRVSRHEYSFHKLFRLAGDMPDGSLQKLVEFMQAPDDEFMTWDVLRQLQSSGLVQFASHTMSHPLLKFASRKWLDWEISRSAALIKQNLGVSVDTMVLPYGSMDNATEELKAALKNHGYKYAFLTERGIIHPGTNRFTLPRICGEVPPAFFKVITSPPICRLLFHRGAKFL